MDYFYCQLVFILLVPIAMIISGWIDFFNKDRAWRITARMLGTVKPQRTPQWERSITINGVVLLGFGTIILVWLLYVLLR